MNLLEHIQRRTIKMSQGMEYLPYKDKLRNLWQFSLEKALGRPKRRGQALWQGLLG